MNKFMPMLKLEEIKDGSAGGGKDAADAPKEQDPAKGAAPIEEGGDSHDDFGYPVSKDPEQEKAEDKKEPEEKKDPAKEPEKVEGLTGYGEEPPDVKDLPPAPEPEKKVEPPVDADELDKAIGAEGLEKEVIAEIKAFAQKIKATPEQAKELADFRRKELADAKAWNEKQEKEYENEKLRRKAAQYQELKTDKEFGGDNFKANLMRVEKILAEMPQTKKILTETKGQLPTWIMRDLAVLSKRLFDNGKLINGEPNAPKQTESKDSFLDEMYS